MLCRIYLKIIIKFIYYEYHKFLGKCTRYTHTRINTYTKNSQSSRLQRNIESVMHRRRLFIIFITWHPDNDKGFLKQLLKWLEIMFQ